MKSYLAVFHLSHQSKERAPPFLHAHHHLSISVDPAVSGQKPDPVGPVLLPKVRKFLVAQGFERGCVKDPQPEGEGIVDRQLACHLGLVKRSACMS